jgi:type II secretory pathway pseudopilin PulG
MRASDRHRSKGIVLLAVLVFVLITTLAASAMVTSYQNALRREKEEQLLFAGDQIRKAILSYYNVVPPGGARSLPASLDALADDQRFATPLHHLRRIYADPLTGAADWELVKSGSVIIGVRSTSLQEPLKKKGFAAAYASFEDARSYSEWAFAIHP